MKSNHPAYVAPRSFWHFSKYVIPADLSALSLLGSKAPKKMAYLTDLMHSHPDHVRIHWLGKEPQAETFYHPSWKNGSLTQHEIVGYESLDTSVAVIQRGRTVGRHNCLIGPDEIFIQDSGYYLDYARVKSAAKWGRLSFRYWRYRWQGDLRVRKQLPPVRSIHGSVAVLNHAWSHNFYHWLLEVAPRIMLIQQAGLEPDWYMIDCQSGYQKAVLNLLGIPESKWLQPHYAQHLQADQIIRPSMPNSNTLREFSKRVLSSPLLQVAKSERIAGKKIYISRKFAEHRKIADEERLENLLKSYGFETYHFEKCSFMEQAKLLSQASMIVAVHGAALANTIFAPPGVKILEIFPEGRYNVDCFPRLSHALGNEHASAIADRSRHRQVLSVNLRDVDHILRNWHSSATQAAA